MKFVSYLKEDHPQLALLKGGLLYDLDALHPALPASMSMFLNYWDDFIGLAEAVHGGITEGSTRITGVPWQEKQILSPVPSPVSCRDAYAFRQHVATARRNRNLDMIPEFDQFPVFYFTNHNSIVGPGDVLCMPDHFNKLDFELEIAVVICRGGRNIRAREADKYIGGYMIMNDFSARTLQTEEMKLNLGPAKGKDFATALGPFLITPDELEPYLIDEGSAGKKYDLTMKAFVNGIQVSEGSARDMNWSFAEIIERASYGVQLYPGDVIGSGTVGTGCFLELNGTRRQADADTPEQWLQPGDEVVLEVSGLGSLHNRMVADEDDFSILALKKGV